MTLSIDLHVGSQPVANQLVDPATTPGVQPLGLLGMTLVESEEFTGAIQVIDSGTGEIRFRDGGPSWFGWMPDVEVAWENDPQAGNRTIDSSYQNYYDLSKISLVSGALRLDSTLDHAHDAVGKPFTSGMIHAPQEREYLHGCFEAKLRLPLTGSGDWPAFWLTSAWYADWTAEIDIMEAFDGSSFNANCWDGAWSQTSHTLDPSNWHVYSVKWTSGVATFYVDGSQLAQITTHVPVDPMFLMLNTGSKTATADTRFECDYIRIWQ